MIIRGGKGSCNRTSGNCECREGFSGPACEKSESLRFKSPADLIDFVNMF